ncbi:amidase [Pseudodonghicola xiamenensis]|uniref:Amidase n=1 Tax=Pseudodonghicola xiamenensis TaxID=337702 RepID=A0A8J3H4Q1_9RHOB|nr:amidase [Pseudodonghicola xiamenensis]GHG79903.1 amidase [Pseudodonghicola xiamenensis]
MTLTRLSAAQLLADLGSRRVSAEELMQETLARIDAVNPAVNAIVALRDSDELMEEARAADQGPPRGPLHGLPIAVKDLVDVAGIVSCHGSAAMAGHIPKADELLAARLRAAGAILIGKTNVPEFGLGSHTFNAVYGATKNPYDPAMSCGGSSGGAAVALATGMTALADGSDMMGSLRNPAAWNNVYGFRPSWGLVPSEPAGDLFLHQLATLGPMGRSPEDIALLLDVIAGPDPRQPNNLRHQPAAPLTPVDPKGMRIGWLGDWGGAYAMEPGIIELCESGLKVFEEMGAHVETLAPPFSAAALWEAWITLRSWQVGAGLAPLMEQPAQRAKLKDTAIWEAERGLGLSAMEVHRASVIRSDWFRKVVALLEDYDALVLPTAQAWPFDVNVPWPTSIAGRAMDTYHRWMEVVVPVSITGLPSLAVPAGFGDQGLPMGFQIFGRRGADVQILALGAAYHAATEWPQKRPAM